VSRFLEAAVIQRFDTNYGYGCTLKGGGGASASGPREVKG
jgi:hypothetical protein